LQANRLRDFFAAKTCAGFPAPSPAVSCIRYFNTGAPVAAAHSSGRRAMRFASAGGVGEIALGFVGCRPASA